MTLHSKDGTPGRAAFSIFLAFSLVIASRALRVSTRELHWHYEIIELMAYTPFNDKGRDYEVL
jgi:hypothetical protein